MAHKPENIYSLTDDRKLFQPVYNVRSPVAIRCSSELCVLVSSWKFSLLPLVPYSWWSTFSPAVNLLGSISRMCPGHPFPPPISPLNLCQLSSLTGPLSSLDHEELVSTHQPELAVLMTSHSIQNAACANTGGTSAVMPAYLPGSQKSFWPPGIYGLPGI